MARYYDESVPHDKVTYAYNVTSCLSRGSGIAQSAAIPANATVDDLKAGLPGHTGDEVVTRCVWDHTLLSIDIYIDPDPPRRAGPTSPCGRGGSRCRNTGSRMEGVLSRGTFCGRAEMRNGVVAVDRVEFVREFPDSPGWGGEGGGIGDGIYDTK